MSAEPHQTIEDTSPIEINTLKIEEELHKPELYLDPKIMKELSLNDEDYSNLELDKCHLYQVEHIRVEHINSMWLVSALSSKEALYNLFTKLKHGKDLLFDLIFLLVGGKESENRKQIQQAVLDLFEKGILSSYQSFCDNLVDLGIGVEEFEACGIHVYRVVDDIFLPIDRTVCVRISD